MTTQIIIQVVITENFEITLTDVQLWSKAEEGIRQYLFSLNGEESADVGGKLCQSQASASEIWHLLKSDNSSQAQTEHKF